MSKNRIDLRRDYRLSSDQPAVATGVATWGGSSRYARTNIQQSNSEAMKERATARLFALSLGGIFFAVLALNAAFR
jgi:hypothetical protein